MVEHVEALMGYCERVRQKLPTFDAAEKRLAFEALNIHVRWTPGDPLQIEGSIPLGEIVPVLLWREWGLPELLWEVWASGIVLAGISAGAIRWFEQGVTDSFAGQLRVLNGLGFLPGGCCPHYDGDVNRRPAYHQLLLNGEIAPGFALDDGTAIHFIDTEVHRIVASRRDAKAYRVHATHSAVQEEPMPVDYLPHPRGGE
jgi:hypothetical protein